MRSTVLASMRNEGPFLVEWVTWYRRLGFTDILVVTNDCTDHSPQLLAAFQAAGWLTQLDATIPEGRRITPTKLAAAKRLPQVAGADWVFTCDVDEFLVIHPGDGTLADLLAIPARPVLGISVNWRPFGADGQTAWQDGLVHRMHRRAAAPGNALNRWVKSMVHEPRRFRALGEHGPVGLIHPEDAALPWVNADGAPVPGWAPEPNRIRTLPPALTSHATAQVNHYMVRNPESFALKRGTLSPVAGKDRYTDDYYARCDRNEVHDDSALRHAAAFDALHAEAMALPNVARLHHLCCMDYVARLAALTGRAPQDDPRWQAHRALAEA
ncbi:glycosyltransferase family 2 protein [Neotabrizicola shimadae]|uniref:Glycosyltransferase family 2 protein n=1 Tax=Neotabrizicola shimadae TaxID=2807096 RepID=A0A8G0ZQ09_9RHOB|nr:glycosyltransferase family 2 protein [Neotabrizicola shimadae]QYZ68314.1 glycosyltransferase family 2 protein [Neotabrizicola shimadae]